MVMNILFEQHTHSYYFNIVGGSPLMCFSVVNWGLIVKYKRFLFEGFYVKKNDES